MTIYEADWICPVSSPPIRNGSIAVDNGKIVSCPAVEGRNVRTFRGCAIIPGFVNAHSHLELTILRGFLEHLRFSRKPRRIVCSRCECALTKPGMKIGRVQL